MLCLQGVNKDSYLILETLPTEYDSRVKAMEVDERPTEQYSDIGGLDKQIQEVREVWQLLAARQPFVRLCLIDQGTFLCASYPHSIQEARRMPCDSSGG